MDAILRQPTRFVFGNDPFNPHRVRPTDLVGAETCEQLKEQLRRTCPRVPGVYGMLSRNGELIYVGKSKSLRSRLLSYFADSSADEKGGRIIEQTRVIQWETQPSDFAALVREQHLIRQHTPRWNVQGVPKRQRPVYLCLGRSPATFYLSSTRPADCVAVEGPFHGAGRMSAAVDALNKAFRLRDCSQKQVFRFAEQLQLFDFDERPGCLRLEIGSCSGPCVGGCSRAHYDAQVKAAESFLDGFNLEPIEDLRERMSEAAVNQQYELAGRIRDSLQSLEYVSRKLQILAKARRDFSFIYSATSYDGCGTWYLICRGELCEVAPAPRSAEQYAAIKPTLVRWSAILNGADTRRDAHHPHTLSLVASWFRKNRKELERTFQPDQAGRKYHARAFRLPERHSASA